jgi:hypothetical protein
MTKFIGIACLAASIALPHAQAQRGMVFGRGGGFGGHFTTPPARGVVISGVPNQGRPFRQRFFPGGIFLGEPWLADYPEDLNPSPPAVVVVETAPATPATAKGAEDTKAPASALLIEWQGDHYVRYNATGINADLRAQSAPRDYSDASGVQLRRGEKKAPSSSAEPLAPAVLIFRDGRRAEVSNYAIIGGVMYVNTDYWTSGAWQQQIQLADLDLPTTFKQNQDRGVRFVLPAGPNEVVTRP